MAHTFFALLQVSLLFALIHLSSAILAPALYRWWFASWNSTSMQSMRAVSHQWSYDSRNIPKGNAWPNPNRKLIWVQWKQLSPYPWGCNGQKNSFVFCKYLHGGDWTTLIQNINTKPRVCNVTLMTFSPFGTVTEKTWNFLLNRRS